MRLATAILFASCLVAMAAPAPIQHNPWTTTTNDPSVTLQAQQPVSITTTNSVGIDSVGGIIARTYLQMGTNGNLMSVDAVANTNNFGKLSVSGMFVDPRNYGMQVNVAADQSSYIQAALNAGNIRFPQGTTWVGSSASWALLVPSNREIFIPPGAVIRSLTLTNQFFDVFYIVNSSNVRIYGGGKVQGEWNGISPTTGYLAGFHILGSTNVQVEGLEITGFRGDGITLDLGAGSTVCSHIGILNNRIYSVGRNGISPQTFVDLQITGNLLAGPHGQDPAAGIDIEPYTNTMPCVSAIISHNNVSSNSVGIMVVNAAGAEVRSILISGNSLTNNGSAAHSLGAIEVQGSAGIGSPDQVTISANAMYQSYFGVGLYYATNTVVINNSINNSRVGIVLDGTSGSQICGNSINETLYGGILSFSSSGSNMYSGNILQSINSTNAAVDGIAVNGPGETVINNIFLKGTHNPRYGFYQEFGASNLVFKGNIFQGASWTNSYALNDTFLTRRGNLVAYTPDPDFVDGTFTVNCGTTNLAFSCTNGYWTITPTFVGITNELALNYVATNGGFTSYAHIFAVPTRGAAVLDYNEVGHYGRVLVADDSGGWTYPLLLAPYGGNVGIATLTPDTNYVLHIASQFRADGTFVSTVGVPIAVITNSTPGDATTIKRWVGVTNLNDGTVYKIPLYQ